MSFMDDLKRWAKGEDEDDLEEEELEAVSGGPGRSRTVRTEDEGGVNIPVTDFRRSSNNKVVNINATTQLSVVLVKPEKFENAVDIADHLREKRTVVLNLEQTNKDVARRLVDFLSGVTYAQDGKIKKVANSTFIITPYNVDILGDLIDELENNGLYI
ncbi:MAG: cell division protein SepF [Clostridiaceae bacterium]|nr:cell division protein SepF [Clostridia bacterium]MDD7312557.1 cell division protein SepF [Clostridia bacterium]MDY3871499.1 cell division protein SepF [Clostridiaceae bacterium]